MAPKQQTGKQESENRLREEAFFSYTRSVCPECSGIIDAHIVLKEKKVIMQKRCPDHGLFETVISSDSDYYVNSLNYTKPGEIPNYFSTMAKHGCPNDCGLCEDHLQHTCSPIIEINDRCDLSCPLCIVENQNNYEMSVENFTKIIDRLIEAEDGLSLVLLSGGEPTLHSKFFSLMDVLQKPARKEHIGRILVSTHGGRLARDEQFAREFKERGLYASLQFDTLKEGVYPGLRGKELYDIKMKTMDTIRKLDIPTVLVITVSLDENSQEVGDIINYGIKLPQVSSIVIQPMAHTGTGKGYSQNPAGHRLTMPDIHRLIEEQTGWLTAADFHPVPCSHPGCYSATYLFKMQDGSYIPLPRFVDIPKYLDAMQNRSIIDAGDKMEKMVHEAVTGLWSASRVGQPPSLILSSLKDFIKKTYSSKNKLNLKQVEQITQEHSKVIFVHSFMDAWDLDIARLKKCCTHYVMEDGTLIPGCSYNNLYRKHDTRFFPDAPLKSKVPVKNKKVNRKPACSGNNTSICC